MLKLLAWLGLFLLAVTPVRAAPLEVTDLAGRTVTIQTPVERFVISEGRYIPLLALLRPDNPVAGLVGMMSPLALTEPALQEQLYEKFPQARDIALFGGTSAESVSVEKIIDLRPQLAIFGLGDHGPGTKNAELLRQLEASGTSILFIDFRMDPLNNTLPSVELLGRVLGAEDRAADYISFYRDRLDRIRQRIAAVATRPRVFVQAHPGRFPCCWGMADGMLGPFVGLAGGLNIADAVAPGPVAQHTEEFLLAENPDVWIGTASGTAADHHAGKTPVALGADVTPEMAVESLKRYLDQPSFAAMDAVRQGRAHSLWHNFYNSPFNIAAVEAFARWIHPEIFADTDPQETLAEIYRRYLPFTLRGTYFATVPHG
ncbi:ABC transporter substrate-binding protein [Oceanibaculum indicum]|uniref:Fe3+-hydroxamate ABC transporter substrate-binding protein n=1 Tax=Oceanibaculum indicum P24 TaxID=1207063 RepID=K2K815_9PROT|nr:ABC transporter substrate-binding protein [Oceanibaculum indicum]EKE79049.1 Fe3+-hydroxamate ABC transporter substrate-binding protein [Oceanibaculum indicum P24]